MLKAKPFPGWNLGLVCLYVWTHQGRGRQTCQWRIRKTIRRIQARRRSVSVVDNGRDSSHVLAALDGSLFNSEIDFHKPLLNKSKINLASTQNPYGVGLAIRGGCSVTPTDLHRTCPSTTTCLVLARIHVAKTGVRGPLKPGTEGLGAAAMKDGPRPTVNPAYRVSLSVPESTSFS